MIYFKPPPSLNNQGNHRESLTHMTGRLGGEVVASSKTEFLNVGCGSDSIKEKSVFFWSQVDLKWSKVFLGIQASEISKPKNPSKIHQKTHLDADRFNVMPRIEMTDLESLWTQKKPDLTACECWKSTRNTKCEQRISGVGLGWFYMILWCLWCTAGLIEWSFAVTGGAEYCRVPVSI